MMRRLRLGDVVEPKRRLGSSTRAMAAGTSRRATTEGVADAPVPTAQTAELTVHGSLDGTLSLHWVGSLAWTRPVAPIGLEWRACRRDPHAVDRPTTGEATGAAHALRLDSLSDPPPLSATLNQGSGSEGQTVGGSAAHPDRTKRAQALATAYYLKRPRYSYYAGCSGGGRTGYAAAQTHPGRFQRHSGRGAFDQPDSVLSGRRLAEPRHPTRPGRRLTHCRASRPGLQSFDLQVGGRLLRSSRGEDLR